MNSNLSTFKFYNGILIPGVILLFGFSSCHNNEQIEKYNGLSLVASRNQITPEDLKPVLEVNANSVAVMPFAFLENLESPHLKFNLDRQWYGERLDGTREAIQILHRDSLSVMLKPQIWIWKGEFTGDIRMKSEADWKLFEENYKKYILLFANLAEVENVKIFSLGTELYNFVDKRPKFWRELVSEVREVYSGKLTYAENWDKIEKVSFWQDLDYIGVDAYFPLNKGQSPSLEELRDNWEPYKSLLKDLSDTNDTPILFTEYGYRNIDFSTKNPWDSGRENKVRNDQLQADALEALYLEIWQEQWFAGGFLWKWHHEQARSVDPENDQFTPQNKPAEAVVRNYYREFRNR